VLCWRRRRFWTTFVSASSLRQAAEATEDDIIRFAREFDPQPFHLDEVAAAATVCKGLVACGWHAAALTPRMLAEDDMPLAAA
jgi:acyl dehydratase